MLFGQLETHVDISGLPLNYICVSSQLLEVVILVDIFCLNLKISQFFLAFMQLGASEVVESSTCLSLSVPDSIKFVVFVRVKMHCEELVQEGLSIINVPQLVVNHGYLLLYLEQLRLEHVLPLT